ncbi:MAG: Uma2 family endonuclease [Lachnospiraceae bacterium]|nr:Uma2 family endonuclease [Lachnospiraceae bacterium]
MDIHDHLPETKGTSDLSEAKEDSKVSGVSQASRIVYPDYADTEPCRLKEAEVAYGHGKRQGEYTIEDYYTLPDDIRAELIDGELYLMAAPSLKHQWILAQLTTILTLYVRNRKGKCMVFPAPLDIQLDRDIWTMLQPDVTILCDRDKAQEKKIYGAPDFVAEILSPSTRRKDKIIKLRKYREAGVRECWLIDPEKETIEVYLFRNPDLDVLPRVYTFDDVVPVGIYDGDCRIDFPDMFRDSMWPRGENA